MRLDEQLVVHLQDKTCVKSAFLQLFCGRYHRDLDYIGGGSLNGAVHSHALAEMLKIFILCRKLGNITLSAKLGSNESALSCLCLYSVKICGYKRKSVKVALDILLRLKARNTEILGKRILTYTVKYTEVYSLGTLAKLRRNLAGSNAEHSRCGHSVYILARQK